MLKTQCDESQRRIVRVELEVAVYIDQLRPYSTILDLSLEDRASRLIGEKCVEGLLWMDGVDRVQSTETRIVEKV